MNSMLSLILLNLRASSGTSQRHPSARKATRLVTPVINPEGGAQRRCLVSSDRRVKLATRRVTRFRSTATSSVCVSIRGELRLAALGRTGSASRGCSLLAALRTELHRHDFFCDDGVDKRGDVKSPQEGTAARYCPTQHHPDAPKQVQEQHGFRKKKDGGVPRFRCSISGLELVGINPALNLIRNRKRLRWRGSKPGVQFVSVHFKRNAIVGAAAQEASHVLC
jgi:hypothetical protein